MYRRGWKTPKQWRPSWMAPIGNRVLPIITIHGPFASWTLPHAAEHVNNIGEFLFGEHTPESQAWLRSVLHCLKHEGPEKLLVEFQGLQQQYPQVQAISGNLAYLEKRKDQIQYPQFQTHGWPIGSGIVESGMEWRQQHPKATFREIEAEVDKRLAVLRARMLSDAAISSAQADWGWGGSRRVSELWDETGKEREEETKVANPRRTRSGIGARVRSMSRSVDKGFFPLDEELELLPGALSPHGHECLVRLASWMPFRESGGNVG